MSVNSLNRKKLLLIVFPCIAILLNIVRIIFYFINTSRLSVSISEETIFSLLNNVLLLIFIIIFYSKNKTSILFPILFIVQSLEYIITVLPLFSYLFSYIKYAGFYGICYILEFVVAAFSILYVFIALQGFTNKKLRIIYYCTRPLIFAVYIFYIIMNVKYFILGYYSSLGIFAIIYIINNTIPVLYPIAEMILVKNGNHKNYFKKQQLFDPEKELLLLKEKYDLGIITEEEYQVQRNDIITKL